MAQAVRTRTVSTRRRRTTNPLSSLWARDRNLFFLIAVVAVLVDFLRVLPLTVSNLVAGDVQPAGLALKIGIADFALALFLVLAHPTLKSGAAIALGFVGGVTMQATTSCPALSGWLAICLPWLLVNRKEFALSLSERRLCWSILPVAFIGYGAVVLSGHVVDPAMQNIGWFYCTTARAPRVGEVVQARISWHGLNLAITRRLAAIEGGLAVLEADNLDFGEMSVKSKRLLRVPSTSLRPVASTWSPRRAWRSRTAEGRFLNGLSLAYSPRNIIVCDRFIVAQREGELGIFGLKGQTFVRRQGSFCAVNGDLVTYIPPDDMGRKWVLNVSSGEAVRLRYEPHIMNYSGRNDTIVLAGDVTAYFPPGRSILIEEKRVTVTRSALKEIPKGLGPESIQTEVTFAPPIRVGGPGLGPMSKLVLSGT